MTEMRIDNVMDFMIRRTMLIVNKFVTSFMADRFCWALLMLLRIGCFPDL